MKKLFIMILCLFLAACGKEGKIEENTKEEVQEVKSETEQIYGVLDGQNLKDSFSNREVYSSINFYDNGEFDGDFLSNSEIDGKDFGLKEESAKTYNRSEIHKSIYSGKFAIENQIDEGVYKLRLEDFTINNQTGPDEEIKYQSWVDFVGGLNKDDEYILYLKDSALDDYLLENNQYSEKEIQIHDHDEEDHHDENIDENDNHDHLHDHGHDDEYRAYGIIIYNKTQKLVFTAHDKWAITSDKH